MPVVGTVYAREACVVHAGVCLHAVILRRAARPACPMQGAGTAAVRCNLASVLSRGVCVWEEHAINVCGGGKRGEDALECSVQQYLRGIMQCAIHLGVRSQAC